jgi:hypothetical protein
MIAFTRIPILFYSSVVARSRSCKLATQETKTEMECSALQQQHERITAHKMVRHESLLRQSDTYRSLLAQSQEASRAIGVSQPVLALTNSYL